MAKILEGGRVVAAIDERSVVEAARLSDKGITPVLAVVRIGERSGDIAYERGAIKRCESVGVSVKSFVLPANTAQSELLDVIKNVNEDPGIHGCLLLRPLPEGMDDNTVRNALSTEKDVDGITDGSLAGVSAGTHAGFPPCTARACMEVLDYYGYSAEGKRAAVIGRSLVVGRPVAIMLLNKNATVTICHTRTADIQSVCRGADILIAAAGRAGFVNGRFLNPGQVVIDVGINVDENGRLCGDVLKDDAQAAGAVTPVPGGVGAVTTSVLAAHVVEAARHAASL